MKRNGASRSKIILSENPPQRFVYFLSRDLQGLVNYNQDFRIRKFELSYNRYILLCYSKLHKEKMI